MARWDRAAEILPKLVLATIPYGVSAIVELPRRLRLWETGDVDELVTRIGRQAAGRQKDGAGVRCAWREKGPSARR